MTGGEDGIRPGFYRKHKRLSLAGLLLVAVCCGVVPNLFRRPEAIRLAGLLCSLPGTFFILLWCYYDAQECQYTLSKTMKICLVAIAAVAFPVYAFRSRGLAGFKTLGWAVLFFLLMDVAMGLGIGLSWGIRYVLKTFS